MVNSLRVALLSGVIALAGCGEEPPPKKTLPKIVRVGPGSDPIGNAISPPSPPASPSVAGENGGSPDISPAPLTPQAAKTETGARAVLLSWARGIELREFDQAWSMMGDSGKAQLPEKEFAALFQPLRDLTVAIPGGTMEGAAGSSYYTVPTTVRGTRADGSKAILKGDVVLRRTNDVPGATRQQLTWHIVSVDLKPA